ncbi:MAG: TetR/AcrR family transcriptional regulator [Gammaproteobacteria bacterium]|nr:TetR/AcrR family transcriptional regulator [Gammaproteobacteria bacterium]MCH9744848.1 TetR/AcrR family transcriptional regulator [Gammaproteobacteria bacterium]
MEASKKQRILAAARELFVQHGYAGTSMGKIAKLAGINHSLIFHHFGNKEKLWLAVKMEIVAESEKNEAMIPATDLSLRQFLEKSFSNLLNFYKHYPDIVRMIHWQRLEINAEKYVRSKRYDEWVAAIKVYQARGDINSTLRPDFVASSIISAACSISLDGYVLLESQDEEGDYVNFCVESLLRSLQ